MKQIMFICTGNQARSQIAEGLAKKFAKDKWHVYSAGLEPKKTVHPYAIQVMQEIGIDISSQKPKGIDEKFLKQMDVVVTLCGDESCPTVPSPVKTFHWDIPDPVEFKGSETEVIDGFRKIREMIRKEVLELIQKEV